MTGIARAWVRRYPYMTWEQIAREMRVRREREARRRVRELSAPVGKESK